MTAALQSVFAPAQRRQQSLCSDRTLDRQKSDGVVNPRSRRAIATKIHQGIEA